MPASATCIQYSTEFQAGTTGYGFTTQVRADEAELATFAKEVVTCRWCHWQLLQIAAAAMPQGHRPLAAPCEGDVRIDVPGPLLPFSASSMLQCSVTKPAAHVRRNDPYRSMSLMR